MSRSGLTVEKNEGLHLPGIELRFNGRPARIPLTTPIILSRLTAAQIQHTILYICTVIWRPRHRWVDNIRMDLQEVGCGYVDWIGLAQDRDRWWTLVSAVMTLRVP